MQTHLGEKGFAPTEHKMRYTRTRVYLECPFCHHFFYRKKNKLSICPKCNTCFTNVHLVGRESECRLNRSEKKRRVGQGIWRAKRKLWGLERNYE